MNKHTRKDRRNPWPSYIAVGLALVIVALLMAGCSEGARKANYPLDAYTVTTESGRTIECIRASGGGLSCDW